MARRLTILAFTLLLSAPAFGQQPPQTAPAPSTRCGGVLCDLYYSGKPVPAPGQPDIPDPTHLPCHDFLCAAFGGRTADPAPPAVQAAPEPVAEPVKTAKHKHKVRKPVASADASKAEPAK